ncbi:MAG: AAA family ATPase [Acidimicrobiales bacterium]
MNRILLATPDAAFEDRIRRALNTTSNYSLLCWPTGMVGSRPDLLAPLLREEPDVVVLGPGLGTQAALEMAEAFRQTRPATNVVVVGEATGAMLTRARAAGVREFIATDADQASIAEVLGRSLSPTGPRGWEADSPQDVAAPDLYTTDLGDAHGRVVVVLSPKGGAGKTTVATNLAVGLARLGDGPVALVDLDLAFGDVAGSLNLDPALTMAHLAGIAAGGEPAGSPAATTIKLHLTRHRSGLYALCAPDAPGAAEGVSPADVSHVLAVLAGQFAQVVVDTASGLDEVALSALEMATDQVMVATTEVPTIRSLHKAMVALDQVGLGSVRRHLVLNRATGWGGVSRRDLEISLRSKVDVAIPTSSALARSVNEGRPLLGSDIRSASARPLVQLVHRCLAPGTPPGARPPGPRRPSPSSRTPVGAPAPPPLARLRRR